ncbi:hypothetical protein GCM10010116_52780 [Microbispora rosea subsp. aerata]|nr:septation protein SepH [Microbispora rosea]GGO26301.1 hypothetical protein GCM10010116_52780 [Microbispora rosea subsp. aerata]GIH54195.1 hypothetical protein Mro02_11090 [Microbispora rosea subsp. aerata]GLJ83614.1 hypothetical protein GCM10017588_23420 [Microbispora rosea subsp. aerata]
MQELRLVAVSEDGTYLVLATAGRGTRFTLPVDDRLRAAVRGNFSRLGQYEIEVESPLRPKEIQARIRAGETAEEIAATAGIPVERVRWFEGPVLQEREYMAQQAQRVAVRMPGETTPGPTLGELVAERLTRRGVPADEIDWDSSKRDDNLWRVKLGFVWNGHTRHAEWLFDPRRRHITPNDDEAIRLSAAEYVEPEPEDATVRPFVPRLASKLTPVPPLPQATSPERDERGLGVPAVRPEPVRSEPAALAEPMSPPRLGSPLRQEPGRPEPYADEPAAYRPELTPVPFRLPQSLVATPDPVTPRGVEADVEDTTAGESAMPGGAAGHGSGRDVTGLQAVPQPTPFRPSGAGVTPVPAASADVPDLPSGTADGAGATGVQSVVEITTGGAVSAATADSATAGATDVASAAAASTATPPVVAGADNEDVAPDTGAASDTGEAKDTTAAAGADATPPVVTVPAPTPPAEATTGSAAEGSPAASAPVSVPPQSRPAEPPSAPEAPAASAAPAAPAQPAAEAAPAQAPAARTGDTGKPAGDGPKDGAKESQKDAKPETPAPPVPKPAPPRPRKSRGRRASVPTWDEIMFGARKQD